MSRQSFLAAAALSLAALVSGCAVLGDPADDPTGELRLERLQMIQSQMSSYLAARTGHAAPSTSAGYQAMPMPYGSGAPAQPQRCRSREAVCVNNEARCVASIAGLPFCR